MRNEIKQTDKVSHLVDNASVGTSWEMPNSANYVIKCNFNVTESRAGERPEVATVERQTVRLKEPGQNRGTNTRKGGEHAVSLLDHVLKFSVNIRSITEIEMKQMAKVRDSITELKFLTTEINLN